jgi:hypothetical protein
MEQKSKIKRGGRTLMLSLEEKVRVLKLLVELFEMEDQKVSKGSDVSNRFQDE